MIDLTKKPEVEYDDGGSGSATVYWNTDGFKEMFSLVIQDGCLIGVMSDDKMHEPWKIELPRGFIKIDCAALNAVEQSDKGSKK